MGNAALIALIGSFMEMDRTEVEMIDREVGGLFVSRFLQRRMADTIAGRDTLTREAFRQFLLPGLYADSDPTNERAHIVLGVPAINHSYDNSVTLTVTRTCRVKCTYCFRGDLVTQEQTYDPRAVDDGIEWIRAHPHIETVVVTGGDPFTLPRHELVRVVETLAAIATVNEIRLDSRVLTVTPASVVDAQDLIKSFKSVSETEGKLWLYSQINSAAEFHPDVDWAITTVQQAGVPIVNQAVILKGVNHTPDLMRDMLYACIKRGIRTDYLYLLDGGSEVESSFNVSEDELRTLFKELWSTRVSGLAKPRAVYVDPLTNTKTQLLLAPYDEATFSAFLHRRRENYRLAGAGVVGA